MKLQHIQEARYHGTPKIISQIGQAIDAAKMDPDDLTDVTVDRDQSNGFPDQFDIDDVDQTIRDISDRYGKYDDGPGESEDYVTWTGVELIPNSVDNSGKDVYRIDVTLDVDNKVVEIY